MPNRLPAALLAAASCAAPAHADALQDQVLAGARASHAGDFAFTRRVVVERDGGERKVFVHRFDPRRAPAQRWTLLGVDGRAPTPKELGEARKNQEQRVPHYGEIARWFGAPASRVASAPGTATYRFARLPAGVLKIGPHDASGHTAAEAVVNTAGRVPYVQQVRLASTTPFRIAIVASVKRAAFRNRYRPAADGRPVPMEGEGDMAGSLLGKAGRLRTSVAYSDFVAVR